MTIKEIPTSELTEEIKDRCVPLGDAINLWAKEQEEKIISEEYTEFYGELGETGITLCILTFFGGETSFGVSESRFSDRLKSLQDRRRQAKKNAITNIVIEYA